ncbi:methylmalonyl Co-A mutase-associated GTPase MeaB [Neolewinella antarctica]|uniref:LAO/AO transport system kinase n=1 Tax=Neolewinella antarctica TaxID=442734 RepID=A0ABX0XEB8_9BACT|nr:methylmalonyl Co-A mutase-associated GTPase MeaB [Neolewinella antarctica]NJC27440.1 LAO/AO transport system kinase [Neolewinella antarctica]
MPTAKALYQQLTTPNNRRPLARAITLLESTRPEDRRLADELLDLALENSTTRKTTRLGVSGTPGVGKSTFVENFGLELIEAGHRLAVLAVDPTSSLSGGSILGDKTRMEKLSHHPKAFIRPSPNAGHLGGVTAATRGAILLCEAAGYDYVIVETVGVGQAEWRVHGMTDAFLLLAQPAAGDDLQSIKRGILELADHIVVNKADRLPKEAKQTALQLRQGLHLAPPRPDDWIVKVTTISALTGQGLPELRERLARYMAQSEKSLHPRDATASPDSIVERRRKGQILDWLKERCEQRLHADFENFLREKSRTTDGLQRIIDERTTLSAATDVLLAEFTQTKKKT